MKNRYGKRFLKKSGLDQFDTKYYALAEGKDIPEGFNKEKEIEEVSELIVCEILQCASDADLTLTIAYSMVVLDTLKHRLNWKLARRDAGIDSLIQKYVKASA